MEANIDGYFQVLSNKLAMDLTVYDSSFLKRSVESRMASQSTNDIGIYIQNLQNDEEECQILRQHLNNSYSEFFRNPLTFNCLEYFLLPQIYERKKQGQEKEIRIWTAACASGQEAYSLAILCDEFLQGKKGELKCRIFATDHCGNEIDKAWEGKYSLQSMGKVSLERFNKYFEQGAKATEYQVISSLREIVDFSVFDLLSVNGASPPSSIYGNFDIVVCCNLLFYYKSDFRQIIFQKIDKSLGQSGFLITGEAEREIARAADYVEVFPNSAIFRKK